MNTLQYLVLAYLGLTCMALTSCLPTRLRGKKLSTSGLHDKPRIRSSAKRLRVLQRMLRQLDPDDLQWLLRQKKFTDLHVVPEYSEQPNAGQIRFQSTEPQSERHRNGDEIECPEAEDGISLFACPTPDRYGFYRCIDEHALCDNKIHCPNGEDENKTVCMFHKTTMRYFKIILDAVYGLSRSLV